MCYFSMKKPTGKVSEKIWFYQWGLGGKNEVNSKNWQIKTLDAIRKELGHTDVSILYNTLTSSSPQHHQQQKQLHLLLQQ